MILLHKKIAPLCRLLQLIDFNRHTKIILKNIKANMQKKQEAG
jgi:hypothetical protein